MNENKTLSLVQLSLLSGIIVLMSLIPFLGYIPLGVIRATIIHVPVIIGSIILGPKKGAILGFLFGLTSFLNNTFNPTITSFVFTPLFSAGSLGGNPLSLIICFVPRILVGIVPYYVYNGISKLFNENSATKGFSIVIAAICGSLTNTVLVMNMIFFFFGKNYASAKILKHLTDAGVAKDIANTVIIKLADSSQEAIAFLSTSGFASSELSTYLSNASLKASDIYSTIILPVISFNGVIEAIVASILVVAIVMPLLKLNVTKSVK